MYLFYDQYFSIKSQISLLLQGQLNMILEMQLFSLLFPKCSTFLKDLHVTLSLAESFVMVVWFCLILRHQWVSWEKHLTTRCSDITPTAGTFLIKVAENMFDYQLKISYMIYTNKTKLKLLFSKLGMNISSISRYLPPTKFRRLFLWWLCPFFSWRWVKMEWGMHFSSQCCS